MPRDLWRSRELLMCLLYREVAVRYRHAFLGYLWALLLPIATVALFAFLASRRVFPMGQSPLPYPVFALWGVIVWQLFANTLAACTASLVNAGPLVTRINFSKETLVFSAVAQPLVDFGIKLLLFAVALLIYGVTPPLKAVWTVPILVLVVLMALGLGCILAILNLLTRDVANLVGMFATLGMFAAPVLYPPPVRDPFTLVNVLNPVSPLLIATQDLLAHGVLRHGDLLLGGALFALSVFLLGWRIFRVVIVRVAERA